MLKDISGKKKYFNNVQPTCCIRANCSWRDNTTLKLSWSLSHCWKQTNRELNKHIEHCLLDNPLRASQNRKKKINVWNGCLGGGGWDSAGGMVFTVDCFKTSPQLLSQSYGLAMQCKCSYTMKTALKSHFFWKYIFLRLLLHRITVAVCLTFDNSIFKLKTSWDNFSSISWERENGGHRQKSHIFYCSVSKKEKRTTF